MKRKKRTGSGTTEKSDSESEAAVPFELIEDGMYKYQKLILPTYGHEGNSDCYYKDGKLYLNNEEVSFDVIWEQKSENVNVF